MASLSVLGHSSLVAGVHWDKKIESAVLCSCIASYFLSMYHGPKMHLSGVTIVLWAQRWVLVLSWIHPAVWIVIGRDNNTLRHLDAAFSSQVTSFYLVQLRGEEAFCMNEIVRRSLICLKSWFLAYRLIDKRIVKVWEQTATTHPAWCKIL